MFTAIQKKRLKNKYKFIDRQPEDRLAERARQYRLIDRNLENGLLGLVVESRDCDMTEATYFRRYQYSTHFKTAQDFDRAMWESEGYCNITVTKWSDLKGNQPPRNRDRALEAFEDGHQHVIYG